MTKPVKRTLTSTDQRARSPKRRKFGTPTRNVESAFPSPVTHATLQNSPQEPVYSTREITWEEQLSLPERFHSEEGVWPARAILQERKRGNKVEYLIEWEPHPLTDEIFQPTWEPKKNIGQVLIDLWEEGKRPKRASELTDEPSQALPPPPPSTASPLSSDARPIKRARIKRLKALIADSSSDLGTPPPKADSGSRPPSLIGRDSDSSADEDAEPQSPSFEISETQAQSSLSISADPGTANFTLEIPPAPFDKSDYESYKDSTPIQQSTATSAKSPAERTLAHRSPSSSRGLSIQQIPIDSSSPALSHSGSGLVSAHRRLAETLSSPSGRPPQIRVPLSSENQISTSEPGESSGLVIEESSADFQARDEAQFRTSNIHNQSLLSSQPGRKNPSQEHAWSSSHLHPNTQSHLLPSPRLQQSPERPLDTDDSDEIRHILGAPFSSLSTSSLWQFESQLPEVRKDVASPTAKSRRQKQALRFLEKTLPSSMDAPAVRQSPRLQSATPVSRTRSPQRAQQVRRARTPQAFGEGGNADVVTANLVTSPLATAPPHIADYSSPSHSQGYQDYAAMSETLPSQTTIYDSAGASALPIQQSIEEEHQSLADEITSKASSSQASLLNERTIPQVDGVSLPTQAVIGPGEWLIGLPAEGKVQSVYTDHINAKRKLVVKFIHRRDSVGSANGSTGRTVERNEMLELMERLQDTTTHIDLGLPRFTQYSIRSEAEMIYAEYAGSKFVFLGELVQMMKRVDCTLVIACKQGPVLDLLADYLTMRQVQVRRHDRPPSARAGTPEALRDTLKVDIISTTSNSEISLSAPPALMIAFDSTFDNQSQHVRRIRDLYSRGRDQPLAVVHLLVTNSAEHVDRCLRKAMPSPQRLKLLVRGTYLARAYLGGSPSYVPHPGDQPTDRPMADHDLKRAVRKSPNRKLQMMAAIVARAALSADFEQHWTLNSIPEVQYDDMDDTPPKTSETTTAAGTAAPTPRDGRMRTRSPISRSATPMGKKRTLDVEAASSMLYKRQRLTPMRDTTPTVETSRDHAKVENLQEQLKAMAIELATEKKARLEAEDARDILKQDIENKTASLKQWQSDHAGLLRRYERQREVNRTLYKENKLTMAMNENIKAQVDKVRETNVKVRGENTQLKKDLADARINLASGSGDAAALETARAEARVAKDRVLSLERSLENTKRDFEFTRQQYQQASNRAAELGAQSDDLELQNEQLKMQASDERRRLKELNTAERLKREKNASDMFEQENKALLVTVRKLQDENKVLVKGRGVQTRGSSAQPPNSPGLGNIGRRSRQASPAVGTRADRDGHGQRSSGPEMLTVPSGGRDRVSAVRNEP